MANTSINTQSQAYQDYHADFTAIVQFWKPYLIQYFKETPERQQAFRDNIVFFDDLLKFVEAVNDQQEQNL
jgi:hypothetical protein